MKSVVIYYSLSGNTHLVAKMIAEKTGADMIRLNPARAIPDNGFGKYWGCFKSMLFRNGSKLANENIRLEDYDTIIIGTPIWGGNYTPPIHAFLSEYTMKEKDIYLFVTYNGSETKKCFRNLRGRLKGNRIKGTGEFDGVKKMSAKELSAKVDKYCHTIAD
mgnify:FL=1